VLFGDKSGSLGIWDAHAMPDEHEEDEKQPDGTAEGGQYWRLQVRLHPWCKVATY
jgi:hypothetical protein